MTTPRNKEDLQAMIDNFVQESLHLDYKSSDALLVKAQHKEISKDVSSFLNSDGGLIVYGVVEKDHLPEQLDAGIDHDAFNRERLEQIILSNIEPRPDGVEIIQIEITARSSAYVVRIPKAYRPHQDSASNRYYKRFNFLSVPMEHYEIEDVRTRFVSKIRLVNIDVEIRHGIYVQIVISNPGSVPATNVRFRFDPPLKWRRNPPEMIANGSRSIPPGRRMHFVYDSFLDLANPNNGKEMAFSVTVSYDHPVIDSRFEETFHFDLKDFMNSSVVESDVTEVGKKIQETLNKIQRDVSRSADALSHIGRIAAPTGLNISLTAFRNLVQARGDEPAFELDESRSYGTEAMSEILKVNEDVADKVLDVLRGHDGSKLDDVEGLSAEAIELIRRLFPARDGV